MQTTTIQETTKIPVNYDWTVKKKLTGHTGYVYSLAISQEGQLISGSFDKTTKIWRAAIYSRLEIRILFHVIMAFVLI